MITWKAARKNGVSMNRALIHEMMISSTMTTAIASPVATVKLEIRNGRVWPRPPTAVANPQTRPRIHGLPRPVTLRAAGIRYAR